MAEVSFLPVLLGSDANVYGMARSFHEAYGVCSIAVSKTIFTPSVDSKIIRFVLEPDLENPEKFLKRLHEVKEAHPDKQLILVPCGDGYVKLMVQYQDMLRKEYALNCPSMEVLQKLTLKEEFYRTCDEYGFAYPKTQVVARENWQEVRLPFPFPVIVKASNSVEYWKCSFPGKKKVFVAQDEAEYRRMLTAIYSSSYQDHLTIQEFIPGDDTFMRVLNCYVGEDGTVKLMALGNPLLEDHTPTGIGSYVAIVNTFDQELLERFRCFLEGVGWRGFANFDMKWDSRDNTYKLFETNPRQGRSSFYVTASGYNLARWLVDDVVEHKEMGLTVAREEHLWIQVPRGIVRRYVQNPRLREKAEQLIKEGKCTNSLFYPKDLSLSRYIKLKLNMMNYYKKYKTYYGKKGLDE